MGISCGLHSVFNMREREIIHGEIFRDVVKVLC